MCSNYSHHNKTNATFLSRRMHVRLSHRAGCTSDLPIAQDARPTFPSRRMHVRPSHRAGCTADLPIAQDARPTFPSRRMHVRPSHAGEDCGRAMSWKSYLRPELKADAAAVTEASSPTMAAVVDCGGVG